MAARETKPNGKSQLIRDLKNGEFATLYIISGEESYMTVSYTHLTLPTICSV